MESVEVWRGAFADPEPLFGPLPGVRSGQVVAYEFGLPDRYTAWPGRTLVERCYLLTDVGVHLSFPPWQYGLADNGSVTAGIDAGRDELATWYVDLMHVTGEDASIIVHDLYIDVMIPVDGRHQRLPDFDDYADAIESGLLPVDVAVDGLRRWQRFLDSYLHHDRDPQQSWTDFPPAAIAELAALPSPLGPVVTCP